MSKKTVFANEIKAAIENRNIILSEEAHSYFMATFCPDPSTVKLSDNAKEILDAMQKNSNETWTSKDLGEMLDKSGRSISGSMRRLVEIGYVEKVSDNPVSYRLTDNGINVVIE